MITKLLIPTWIKVAVILAVLAGYSWWWYDLGYDKRDHQALQEQVEATEKAAKDRQDIQDRLNDVSSKLQDALANVRVETKYIDRIITKEIEKPIYTQCVVPDTGKVILNDNADRLNRLRK